MGQCTSSSSTQNIENVEKGSETCRISSRTIQSNEGILLTFLAEFLETYSHNLVGLTTSEVCTNIIKPVTNHYSMSFCEYLKIKSEVNSCVFGEANIYISHSWDAGFVEVCETILNHYDSSDHSKIVIWMDVFSSNQLLSSFENGMHWWSIEDTIKSINNTLLVLTSDDNLCPCRQGFNQFELYCSMSNKCTFDLVTSRKEFDLKKGPKPLLSTISTIDIKSSYIVPMKDKTAILKRIQDEIGYDRFNFQVIELIYKWASNFYLDAIQSEINIFKKTEFKCHLAEIYSHQKKYVLTINSHALVEIILIPYCR